ncbi:protocadherin gamma-B4-like [Synchiropus splendidus]|uniref:protocadherin gamma-B4-like n=1 Tax=Synchiropus splendidus TaxID=270530 RepID=UPI00237E0645|nr:protocadherin gamma-B4-like [Synchiropus splendidus]
MEDEEDATQLAHQISAVDDDSDVNSQLTYTLEDANGDDFELTSNGSLHISPRLDRERQSSYTLSIIAVDSGSPPLTGTMTVHIMVDDVNDNSPQFSEEVFNTIVSEDSPPGTAFAMITASDMDEGTNGDVRHGGLCRPSDRSRRGNKCRPSLLAVRTQFRSVHH